MAALKCYNHDKRITKVPIFVLSSLNSSASSLNSSTGPLSPLLCDRPLDQTLVKSHFILLPFTYRFSAVPSCDTFLYQLWCLAVSQGAQASPACFHAASPSFVMFKQATVVKTLDNHGKHAYGCKKQSLFLHMSTVISSDPVQISDNVKYH